MYAPYYLDDLSTIISDILSIGGINLWRSHRHWCSGMAGFIKFGKIPTSTKILVDSLW